MVRAGGARADGSSMAQATLKLARLGVLRTCGTWASAPLRRQRSAVSDCLDQTQPLHLRLQLLPRYIPALPTELELTSTSPLTSDPASVVEVPGVWASGLHSHRHCLRGDVPPAVSQGLSTKVAPTHSPSYDIHSHLSLDTTCECEGHPDGLCSICGEGLEK